MKIRSVSLVFFALIAHFYPTPVQAAIACPVPVNKNQTYDVIIYGDEVPGVMTAIKLERELKKRNQSAKVAIITEGNINLGIGGHIVRGGLEYLDRNQVPKDMRAQLGRFAAASQLYQEFLDMSKTEAIAIDRFKANAAFKKALAQGKINVIGNINLQAVTTAANTVCSITTIGKSGLVEQEYTAQQFIDASQGGEMAKMAGVKMLTGFSSLGLPESSLSVGLIFETYGLSIQRLAEIELKLIRRFQNPKDIEAQEWLQAASGYDPIRKSQILSTMFTVEGVPRTMYQGTDDSADVRSLALTTAFHGQNAIAIQNSRAILDRPNIAVLDNRLSFNALLFFINAEDSQKLTDNGAKPEPYMLEFADKVKKFFRNLGANKVEVMRELYVRGSSQIANPIEELSATIMTKGGVEAEDALGTFSYHLDVRGGIKGFGARVVSKGLKKLNLYKIPTFNYGFRHTLPQERQNLAVLSPASGFGGLGKAAGRIVEFNVSVGEGLAIAMAKAITEKRSLHSITNREVRQALGYFPIVYGRPTESYPSVFLLEKTLRTSKKVN